MTSKEALERLSKYNNHYVKDKEYFLIDVESEEWKAILRDLKEKEKQDKILERLERPMFYSERKKLGEEYIEWAKENNVLQNDLTSIITWCFCFKMKEWLENDK